MPCSHQKRITVTREERQRISFNTFCSAFCTPNFWVEMNESSRTRIAMSTSSCVTCCLRCILACASDIRIMDSMCLTAMGTPCPCYMGKMKKRDISSNHQHSRSYYQIYLKENLPKILFAVQHKHVLAYPNQHHAALGIHST